MRIFCSLINGFQVEMNSVIIHALNTVLYKLKKTCNELKSVKISDLVGRNQMEARRNCKKRGSVIFTHHHYRTKVAEVGCAGT
jgi:flagellar hook assembly protein FlgD